MGWQAAGLAAETLIIPGTGACEPVLKVLAGAFNAKHPGKEVLIPPSIGTRGGLRDLLDDKCELARIVLPLDGGKMDPRVQYRAFAQDAVVFAVGAKLGVESLTRFQLAEIFAGKITDWREVGGAQGLIRVIVRDPGDSILQCMQFHFKEFQTIHLTPEAKVAYHDADMMRLLKKYQNGIGMAAASGLHDESSLKALAIGGIPPNAANLRNGNYRPHITYALAFTKSSLPELGRNFLEFLFTGEARAIIENHGLIPIEPK